MTLNVYRALPADFVHFWRGNNPWRKGFNHGFTVAELRKSIARDVERNQAELERLRAMDLPPRHALARRIPALEQRVGDLRALGLLGDDTLATGLVSSIPVGAFAVRAGVRKWFEHPAAAGVEVTIPEGADPEAAAIATANLQDSPGAKVAALANARPERPALLEQAAVAPVGMGQLALWLTVALAAWLLFRRLA